jgi:hypothetical protein
MSRSSQAITSGSNPAITSSKSNLVVTPSNNSTVIFKRNPAVTSSSNPAVTSKSKASKSLQGADQPQNSEIFDGLLEGGKKGWMVNRFNIGKVLYHVFV